MRWVVVAVLCASCGGGGGFYAPCDAADQCADVVPEGATGECVEGGTVGSFCAWDCTTDGDCADDRDDRYDFVCSPLESNGGTYCFPSCEDAADDATACPEGYECRSSGGGSDNRKVCFPA